MSRTQRFVFYAILTAALLFRLSLALLNREANDDHMQVVHLILQQGSLPVKADCWECFQPKLFHFTVASLSRVLGVASPDGQILLAQFLNMLAGLLTLWALWQLLKKLNIGDTNGKLLAFGLLALNPNLLTTDIQATNDTFAIAFSSLVIFFAYSFISRKNRVDFGLMTLFSVLAASSKTNGAVTVAAIAAFLVIRAAYARNFSLRWPESDLLPAVLYGLLTLLLVVLNPLNQYIQNIQLYGSPVVMNMDRADFPQLLTPTETERPGIVSIQDGFFTFKLSSLLVEPQITRENKNYPAHRTSFWTVLYGRSNFIQYNPWPPSWINDTRLVRMLGRFTFVLALLPTAALLIGFFLGLKALVGRPLPGFSKGAAGFFLVLLAAYLGFAVLYALEYRIYTVIKAIFIFPAVLSFGFLYLLGYDWLRKINHSRLSFIRPVFQWGTYILLVAYGLDVLILVLQLASVRGLF